MKHVTDNHDVLLDYLYEEGDPAVRLTIAQHLQECAECSVAVLELQNVRGMLREWTPPAADLGFRVVRDGAAVSGPEAGPASRSRMWWAPRGVLQAAAAVLLFVAGMAVSQVRVEYGDRAITLRTAASPSGARASSIALPPSTPAPPAVDLDELERIIRARLALPAGSGDTEQLLQRVRSMIDQSEQRQQRELALRLSQVASEVDTQHQADLLRIQQSLGQQQEEVMNYLVRTAGGPR